MSHANFRQIELDERVKSEVLTFAKRFGRPATPPAPRLIDAAWTVMTCANDLHDHDTVTLCRRVIDAQLLGRRPLQSDLDHVLGYFK